MSDATQKLFNTLRYEGSAHRRNEIVLSALSNGISPREIETVLDQLEFEQQVPIPKPNVRKPNILSRLYWYVAQRSSQNVDAS